MPYKGELPITTYFSRVSATSKHPQPRTNKRGAVEEGPAKGKAKQPVAKKLKVKDEFTPKSKPRAQGSREEQRLAVSGSSHDIPGPVTPHIQLAGYSFSAAENASEHASSSNPPASGLTSSPTNSKSRGHFKPPSVRISASAIVIDLVALEENEDISTLSRRSSESEEFVPSSQTQELDYDFSSGSRASSLAGGPLQKGPAIRQESVVGSPRRRSVRKLRFTESTEMIPPENGDEYWVESSQTQHMIYDESCLPEASFYSKRSPSLELSVDEVIPSSQSQWDPSAEVDEDLLADTTLVAQSRHKSATNNQTMRRSRSPPSWSQTQPEDLEDELVACRSRSRSPSDPVEHVDRREPHASTSNDISGSKPGYAPTEHTPSSPSRSTQSFPPSQAEASQVDVGSSLPSVVKDFRDMFDDESSYPIDFPMSLRL